MFFWDGRAGLEEQALGPIQAAGEMNLPLDKAVARLQDIPFYVKTFAEVYPESGITPQNIGRAMAAFERTIISNNSPFDRYVRGDQNAMGPDAIRGLQLFMGKANCIACHSGPNFTDESFHNIGIGDTDPVRAAVIHDQSLTGAFKTSGLRNVLLCSLYARRFCGDAGRGIPIMWVANRRQGCQTLSSHCISWRRRFLSWSPSWVP